jgi:thiol-disulfide isomerase/thioredoxin
MAENGSSKNSRLWTPGRVVASLVVVAAFALIGRTIFSGGSELRPVSSLEVPGKSVSRPEGPPPDFAVPTVDGGVIRLSEYQGKVLVLDFWATWCPPCQQEVPDLIRIAKENRSRGLEVVGLHIDDRGRSTAQSIKDFIRKYQINYPVGLANDEMFSAYLGRDDDTIPQTLVFGRDGKLVAHLSGYTPADSRKLARAVDRALSGT